MRMMHIENALYSLDFLIYDTANGKGLHFYQFMEPLQKDPMYKPKDTQP